MPKKRVSNSQSQGDRSPLGGQKECHVYLGLSLGGGKADTACLSALEYYPKVKKLFLSQVHDQIKTKEYVSADQRIIELVRQKFPQALSLTFDVPFELPLCTPCELVCPGYEQCQEEHIQWMWKQIKKKHKEKKRPKRLFTPYTQRAVEFYLNQELEEPFHRHDVLGGNLAPLTMRANFLSRRFNIPLFEAYPHLTLWRLGLALKIPKRGLRNHRSALFGEQVRAGFLEKLSEQTRLFMYQQDHKIMVHSSSAFDSFLCALTGFFKAQNQTEPRPKDFPERESWIDFPIKNVDFESCL